MPTAISLLTKFQAEVKKWVTGQDKHGSNGQQREEDLQKRQFAKGSLDREGSEWKRTKLMGKLFQAPRLAQEDVSKGLWLQVCVT